MSNRGHYLSCSSLPKVANLILTWSISYLFSVTPVLLCTLILLLLSPTLAFYSSTWRNRKWCFPHLMFSTFGTQYGNWRENFCYEALHAHLHFGGNRGGSLLCPCNICPHQRCQMTAADGSDQDVRCSFSLSVLKHHFSLADSESTACTLKRLIPVLQGKSFVYDIQTPKQDACFSLLYSHHTTSQTSQDMSPIKSEGNTRMENK